MRRQSFSKWFAAGVLSSAVLVPSAAWGQGAPCPAFATNGSVSSGCALAANGTTASGNAEAIGILETEMAPPAATTAQPGQVVATAAPTQPSLAPTPTGGVALSPTTPSLQPQTPSLTPLLPASEVSSLVPQLTLAPAPLVAALQAAPAPQATPAPTSSSASSGSTPSLVRTGGSHQDMAVSGVLAVVIGAALVVIAQARRRPVQAVASS